MEQPVVKVKDGSLKGIKVKGAGGVDFFSFYGIPYAEPPINELRFQDPRPCKPWTGVRDATKEPSPSMQYDFFVHQMFGSEDSLYLNVATTSLTGNRAVLVWIHGGGFNLGSSSRDFYGPDYLVKHDLIYVSMNFRLGIYGFLNMGVPDCAGNQSLKDILLSLKWIQENISVFGGDPKNVTIFGESAGAASVHALCLSPLSKGLFHKAIIQSGTMYGPWAYKHTNQQSGMILAKKQQPNVSNAKEALEVLRKMPKEELSLLSQQTFPLDVTSPQFHFAPTNDSASVNPVIPKKLDEYYQTPIDLPVILGYTSYEGIMFSDYRKESIMKYDKSFIKYIQRDYHSPESPKIKKMAAEIRKFYFADRPITELEIPGLVQYNGDMLIINSVQHLVDVQLSSKFPTYFYRFAFSPVCSMSKLLYGSPVQGASHTDDLSSLFYGEKLGPNGNIKERTKDELVKDRMTRMWADFAKYGNPTPKLDDLLPVKWHSLTPTVKYYYEISDEVSLGVDPGKRSWDFWKSLDVIQMSYNLQYS